MSGLSGGQASGAIFVPAAEAVVSRKCRLAETYDQRCSDLGGRRVQKEDGMRFVKATFGTSREGL